MHSELFVIVYQCNKLIFLNSSIQYGFIKHWFIFRTSCNFIRYTISLRNIIILHCILLKMFINTRSFENSKNINFKICCRNTKFKLCCRKNYKGFSSIKRNTISFLLLFFGFEYLNTHASPYFTFWGSHLSSFKKEKMDVFYQYFILQQSPICIKDEANTYWSSINMFLYSNKTSKHFNNFFSM